MDALRRAQRKRRRLLLQLLRERTCFYAHEVMFGPRDAREHNSKHMLRYAEQYQCLRDRRLDRGGVPGSGRIACPGWPDLVGPSNGYGKGERHG